MSFLCVPYASDSNLSNSKIMQNNNNINRAVETMQINDFFPSGKANEADRFSMAHQWRSNEASPTVCWFPIFSSQFEKQ